MNNQIPPNKFQTVLVQTIIDGKLYAVNVPDNQLVRNMIISTIAGLSDKGTLGLVALPDSAKLMTGKDLKACQ